MKIDLTEEEWHTIFCVLYDNYVNGDKEFDLAFKIIKEKEKVEMAMNTANMGALMGKKPKAKPKPKKKIPKKKKGGK